MNTTGTAPLSTETMYNALLEKDSSYEGLFVVGVKTTGIFCRPTCTARKPKKENVEFFESTTEAMHYGYRPCKVCAPLDSKGGTPAFIKDLIKEINENPFQRIKDYDLRKRGLEPNHLRRWFKKNHGITFHAYQRFLKINNAFGSIKHGEKIPYAAYDNGFESLSGFNDAFNRITGFTPGAAGERSVVTITRIPTPLGPMMAGATEDGICLLEFTDRRMLPTQLARIKKLLRATLIPGENPLFDQLSIQLEEYFEGSITKFNIPLVVLGTPFQKKVWDALMQIPYGATRSYKEQATLIGNPEAVRAVARANGDNRIAIIIPCHRVIGSDGNLTGYGGGLHRKKWLLDHERKNASLSPLRLPAR